MAHFDWQIDSYEMHCCEPRPGIFLIVYRQLNRRSERKGPWCAEFNRVRQIRGGAGGSVTEGVVDYFHEPRFRSEREAKARVEADYLAHFGRSEQEAA